ncbi:MAG: hypothetical protein HQL69_15265 [Magnetococcales bacterium]|nr:hypothetical protein [Magnetococcales bacterium]
MNNPDVSLTQKPQELAEVEIPSLDAQSVVVADNGEPQSTNGKTEDNQQQPDASQNGTKKSEGGSTPPKKKKDKKKPVTSGKRIIGLMLPSSYMVYRVAANFPELEANDSLLLQTSNGEVVGRVVYISSGPPQRSIDSSRLFPGRITRIIRKLSKSDLANLEKNRDIEKRAKLVCRKAIRDLKLPMKLAKVTYQQKGSKILFHFTSEGRVDFRELVRQLGTKLKNRIEMRHVGVRDETRLLNGLGPCGKELCCSQYLQKFHPVSVRMAKNQDLSLNPDGISGVCGRLLCCLAYENDTYVELKKGLPKIKKCCWTKSGREATVKNVHTLSGMVTLQYKDGAYETVPAVDLSKDKPDITEIQTEQFNYDEVEDSPKQEKNKSNKKSKTDKPSGAKKDTDKPDTLEAIPNKPSKKRRNRRRRRGRGNKEGGEQNQEQNSQNQTASQAGQAKSNPDSTKPQAKQENRGGEAKDTEAAKKGDGTKRRRRRRRRRGNKGGGGEKPAATTK